MKYKVIGWTSKNSNNFLSINKEEMNDDIKSAISIEIKKHHYLFNAFDHDNKSGCVPVLNNYRKVLFNHEDFALLFKSSFDYLKSIDLSVFLKDELLDEKDKCYPKETKTILERKDLFSKFKISQSLYASINSFFLDKEFEHQNIYLFPVMNRKDYHYWINDRLMLSNDHVQDKIFGQILLIYSFKDENEFNDRIKEIKDNNPKIRFGYSLREINKYKGQEFVLLGFSKASAEDYLIDIDLYIKNCQKREELISFLDGCINK